MSAENIRGGNDNQPPPPPPQSDSSDSEDFDLPSPPHLNYDEDSLYDSSHVPPPPDDSDYDSYEDDDLYVEPPPLDEQNIDDDSAMFQLKQFVQSVVVPPPPFEPYDGGESDGDEFPLPAPLFESEYESGEDSVPFSSMKRSRSMDIIHNRRSRASRLSTVTTTNTDLDLGNIEYSMDSAATSTAVLVGEAESVEKMVPQSPRRATLFPVVPNDLHEEYWWRAKMQEKEIMNYILEKAFELECRLFEQVAEKSYEAAFDKIRQGGWILVLKGKAKAQKRYFVLDGVNNSVAFLKSQPVKVKWKAKPGESISISSILKVVDGVVSDVDLSNFVHGKKPQALDYQVFSLVLADRIIELCAPSGKEKVEWIDAFTALLKVFGGKM